MRKTVFLGIVLTVSAALLPVVLVLTVRDPDSRHPFVLLETDDPILGLALKGSDLAWLTSSDDCRRLNPAADFSLHLGRSGRVSCLPWPDDEFGDNDTWVVDLALTGQSVGWKSAGYDAGNGVVRLGASSLRSGRARLLETDSTEAGGVFPDTGRIITDVAVVGDRILLGTVDIELLDTPEFNRIYGETRCDIMASTESLCRTRISGGSVVEWREGDSKERKDLPPAAALTGNGEMIALATWPAHEEWSHGYPPLGDVIVQRDNGEVIARIELPEGDSDSLAEIALSSDLLAVCYDGGIWVYGLPSGHLLRRIPWL